MKLNWNGIESRVQAMLPNNNGRVLQHKNIMFTEHLFVVYFYKHILVYDLINILRGYLSLLVHWLVIRTMGLITYVAVVLAAGFTLTEGGLFILRCFVFILCLQGTFVKINMPIKIFKLINNMSATYLSFFFNSKM